MSQHILESCDTSIKLHSIDVKVNMILIGGLKHQEYIERWSHCRDHDFDFDCNGRREGRRGRCRGHVMEQHQHSQTSIAPISDEQIPIENRPSTSYLIDDIEDTNVVFYVPNATDIPIVSDVSIALDVLVAYDVLIASDVLVAINVSIASDVPVASEVQLAYDVPFDVHITFDVHASINATYQRCPRRKRRALPCGT
ncbi:hypothetical protein CK203_043898 [Vitis vinifera]|uniref:Uncharacterized protein n=1 Tax=Vitis vinifera TaxID=29760 RepID=A0A438HVJ2_VITVI|nr:hypothetical protein CK203_043898 [Vitis vinifera]